MIELSDFVRSSLKMLARCFVLFILWTIQLSAQANEFKVGDEVIARKSSIDHYSTIIGIDSRNRYIAKVSGVMESVASDEKTLVGKILGGLHSAELRLIHKEKRGVSYLPGDILVAYSNLKSEEFKPLLVKFLGTRSSYLDNDSRNVFLVERADRNSESDSSKRLMAVAVTRDYTSLSRVLEPDDLLYKKNMVVSENESGDIWLLLGMLEDKNFLLSNPFEKKMKILSKTEISIVENLTSEIFDAEEDPSLLIPSLKGLP